MMKTSGDVHKLIEVVRKTREEVESFNTMATKAMIGKEGIFIERAYM